MAASEVAVVGMLDSLADAFHLDPSWRAARAGNKLSQLRLAPACSLEVPRTMVTNDPDAVRAFARRAGPLVTKMLVQPPLPAGEEETAVVFTSAVTEADLRDLDGLPMCPMIFQERIEKQLEIRATIVGHEVFSAAIDVSGSGEVDWRRVRLTGGAVDWTPCELPADVRAGLVGMLDRLGLNFGAFDLVRTAAGRHVFLELNPFGSFAFLGQAWEGPIAAAIADVLVDPGARRLPGGGR
jgi:glutathione synthase/RimK-type ligase-like ATP-grasp enzyme